MKKSFCVLVLLTIHCGVRPNALFFVKMLAQYVTVPSSIKQKMISLIESKKIDKRKGVEMSRRFYDRPLFASFPILSNGLPCVQLGDLPTPISRLTQLESHCNSRCALYMKDDGLTGQQKDGVRSFGGNKIRKLEFLLADAVAHGAQSVMTYGCIGSNHVVATATSAKQLGLRCIAQLSPQDVTDVVKRNMLLMQENDAQMILNPNREIRSMQTVCSFVQNQYEHGDYPYFIPTGGSSPIGVVGFVNAAFELKEQIKKGLMPEPDYIYAALGSCGTVAGLMLGVRAIGLKTKIIGVAVEPDSFSNPFAQQLVSLIQKTNSLLHEKDAAFPLFNWSENDVVIRHGFSGSDYGVVTKEGVAAIQLFADTQNVQLDTTYTGKAAAGMLHDIAHGACDEKTVLFWNTFCAQVAAPSVTSKQLPKSFHQFFKTS